jgi:phospholipid/cholesterol/gamma-HCH transport system substrate-binding protein
VIQNQLRPFTRVARPVVRDLQPAARDLAATTPRLRRVFGVLNSVLNEFAYNPPGKEEGFLFYQSWLNHAGAALFETDDAHGPIRRGLVMISCTSLAILDQVKLANPQLQTLIELLNGPRRSQVCPQPVTGSPPAAASPVPAATARVGKK